MGGVGEVRVCSCLISSNGNNHLLAVLVVATSPMLTMPNPMGLVLL